MTYRGQEYFIKGRMASGYAILMDIQGIKQALRPIPKLGEMERVAARGSKLVMEGSIHLPHEGARFLEYTK